MSFFYTRHFHLSDLSFFFVARKNWNVKIPQSFKNKKLKKKRKKKAILKNLKSAGLKIFENTKSFIDFVALVDIFTYLFQCAYCRFDQIDVIIDQPSVSIPTSLMTFQGLPLETLFSAPCQSVWNWFLKTSFLGFLKNRTNSLYF